MEITLLLALISPIAALVGVYLGHRWTASAALSLVKRSEQRQRKAIKSILDAEVTRNLDSLRELWAKVVVDTTGLQGGERVGMLLNNMHELKMPSWERDLWESQFPVLGLGLTSDQIQEYSNFHRGLEDFSLEMLSRKPSIDFLLARWANRESTKVNEADVIHETDAHLERTGNSVRALQALGEHLIGLPLQKGD